MRGKAARAEPTHGHLKRHVAQGPPGPLAGEEVGMVPLAQAANLSSAIGATALVPRTHAIGDAFKEVLLAHDRFNAG